MTDFAYGGPNVLVPLSLSYPSSPVSPPVVIVVVVVVVVVNSSGSGSSSSSYGRFGHVFNILMFTV